MLPEQESPRAGRAEPLLDPARLIGWAAELMRTAFGVVDAYGLLGRGVDSSTRERLILAVSEVNDCRWSAWVHSAWLDFIRPVSLERAVSVRPDALDALFDYARASARAGRPLDAAGLEPMFPPEVVRSVRATVAVAQLGNAVDRASSGLVRPGDSDAGAPGRPGLWALPGLLVLPLAVSSTLMAGAMRIVASLAPPLPEVQVAEGDDGNLVAHLLAHAAPSYLGHALVRASLLWSPVPVAVAFWVDGTAATVRIGRGRIVVSNGVAPDALMVVDGGEVLARHTVGTILDDLGLPPARRRP